MTSKTKSVGAILLIAVLLLGSVGIFVVLANNKTSESNGAMQFVEVNEMDGKLSSDQIRLINNGAMITYNGEIYQLSQIGKERIYAYNDAENIFIRKYIGVNTEDGFYHSWEKVNDDLVTKALLNSALSDYATGSDVDSALSNALAGYLNNEDVKKTISAALVSYVKSADLGATLADYLTDETMQRALSDILASYVKKTDGTGLVQQYFLTAGEVLNFEKNTMYLIYCFDNASNLQSFELVGGTKSGKTGKFALALYGENSDFALTIYQTGSAVIGNLVATSGGTLSIKPANVLHHLVYFKLGGKTF